MGIDATTLEANAALRSGSGEGWSFSRLGKTERAGEAAEERIQPRVLELVMAHKAEHAVDLETGAIVAVTVQGADQGDTTTMVPTLREKQLGAIKEVVAEARRR